jgi:hypothetical protein
MENEVDPNLSPELKDIKEMVMRYNVTHPQGCFIFRFVGYKSTEEICPDCGEKCDCTYDENKSDFGICGDIETVREMLNELRDISEDCKDEDGVVIV